MSFTLWALPAMEESEDIFCWWKWAIGKNIFPAIFNTKVLGECYYKSRVRRLKEDGLFNQNLKYKIS